MSLRASRRVSVRTAIGAATLAIALGGQGVSADEATPSRPLLPSELKELALSVRCYRFDTETYGRSIIEPPGAIAVESYYVTLPDGPPGMFNYAELVALAAETGLPDSARICVHYQFAVIEGDSAAVGRALVTGSINWYEWPVDAGCPPTVIACDDRPL